MYNKYSSGLRKLCYGYCGDTDLADDLLQDTFLSVWKNLEKFRGEAKLSTWIYRIAVNTCLSNIRKQKLKMVKSNNELLNAIPETKTDTESHIKTLYKSISLLKEADRFIIMLFLEEKTYQEIAEITGFKESNLRVKIHRIKKELTEIYKSNEQF
ncbi:RNA polymerase subunit sigma-24 [Marivirga lumbricoides]|uniref:RNA polymerase sigma factor n=1 Tax=Marivirga lumbricoides TaxID=1046115 RepID=A0A2T4DCU9_9BACT|nr:RNA polymerase subunit sigma-24 [Marivirga lumbricoides]